MSKLTGKPYPTPPVVTKEDFATRFKEKAKPAAPKGIVEAVKDAASKAFSKKKK